MAKKKSEEKETPVENTDEGKMGIVFIGDYGSELEAILKDHPCTTFTMPANALEEFVNAGELWLKEYAKCHADSSDYDDIRLIPHQSMDHFRDLKKSLTDTMDAAGRINKVYNNYLSIADKTINDIEHSIVFDRAAEADGREFSSYFSGGIIPQCLKGVDREKYPELLSDVLQIRREIKDCAAVYKTIEDKLKGIIQFISGMDKRVYNASTSLKVAEIYSNIEMDNGVLKASKSEDAVE